MKKFSVPCTFNGTKSPVTLYIGTPEPKHHPVSFQADWLSKERGGSVPQEVMDSLDKLMAIASKNDVMLEDLCEYALHAASVPSNTVIGSGVEKAEELPGQSAGLAIGSDGSSSAPIVETAEMEAPAEAVEVPVEATAEETLTAAEEPKE